MTADAYTFLIFLAGLVAGVTVTLLAQVTPDFFRALQLIRLFLKTRDRRRALELWQAEEARRRQHRA